MSSIRASSETTQQHYKFVTNMWNGHGSKADEKPIISNLEDITIAGLGLAGEAGEVAMEVEKLIQGEADQVELIKELGDARYYWFKLVDIFQLNLNNILPQLEEATLMDNNQSGEGNDQQGREILEGEATKAVSKFLVQSLQAVECIKKFVRDRTGKVTPIATALRKVDQAFIGLLGTLNISEEVVMQRNQEKLIERFDRDKKAGSSLKL